MQNLLILFSRITFADNRVADTRVGYVTDAKLIVTSLMVRPYLNARVVKECSLRTREKLLKITSTSARPSLADIQELKGLISNPAVSIIYKLFTCNLSMLSRCDFINAHSFKFKMLKSFVVYTKNVFHQFSACLNIPISSYTHLSMTVVSAVLLDCVYHSCNLYHFQKVRLQVIDKQKTNKLKTTLRNSYSNIFLKAVHLFLFKTFIIFLFMRLHVFMQLISFQVSLKQNYNNKVKTKCNKLKIATTNLKQNYRTDAALPVVLSCLEWYNIDYTNTISKQQHGHGKRKGKKST